jgi:hypothetical protein
MITEPLYLCCYRCELYVHNLLSYLAGPMEVTRQLRLDALNKLGLAPIQLTLCWANQRLRLGSGQRCLPKHWDERRQHVKEKPDSYASTINQVLDDYTTAAGAGGY